VASRPTAVAGGRSRRSPYRLPLAPTAERLYREPDERMALVSASSPDTLQEAYGDLARRPEPGWRSVAAQMLELIPLLEDVCAAVPVWGLISVERLCLLAVDNFHSRRYVVIAAQGLAGGYNISGGTSSNDADLPNAVVEHADSPQVAAQLVRTAMVNSGAWPDLL